MAKPHASCLPPRRFADESEPDRKLQKCFAQLLLRLCLRRLSWTSNIFDDITDGLPTSRTNPVWSGELLIALPNKVEQDLPRRGTCRRKTTLASWTNVKRPALSWLDKLLERS